MFTIGIRYLNGFSAAAEYDDRNSAEWPPHPGRIFMAMAATHFETGGDSRERAALEWLESLDPPLMHAPDGLSRSVVTHFVPVNDSAGPSKAMLQSAPVARDRQARTFARKWLDDDTVWYVWSGAEPSNTIREAFASLCSKVTRIGHSSSLVHVWLADNSQAPHVLNWVPNEDSPIRFRVTKNGTLVELERRFNGEASETYASLLVAADDDSDRKAQKTAREEIGKRFGEGPPVRKRPQLSTTAGYEHPQSKKEDACHSEGTVLSPYIIPLTLERLDGPFRRLEVVDVLTICQRWHEAFCSLREFVIPNIASILSGHGDNGDLLDAPHLSFVPLAFAGHPHADGSLLGIALALPVGITRETRRSLLAAIGRVRELKLGRLGRWRLAPVTDQCPALSLLPETWTGYPKGATRWATVTPIVFDQHPKAKDKEAYYFEIASMIRLACKRVGLPHPREICATPVSAHLGVPPAHVFPRMVRKDGSQRRHSHAIIVFEQPVHGPILLGAGRYRGYGLCRPMAEEF